MQRISSASCGLSSKCNTRRGVFISLLKVEKSKSHGSTSGQDSRGGVGLESRQGRAQFIQFVRFVEHPVHVRRNVVLGDQPLAPAGEQNDGGGRRRRFHG